MVMFSVTSEDERTKRNSLPELSLEFEWESNFDKLVIAAYGCELNWRRAVVAWMTTVLSIHAAAQICFAPTSTHTHGRFSPAFRLGP